jgi:hypothetical protein
MNASASFAFMMTIVSEPLIVTGFPAANALAAPAAQMRIAVSVLFM